MKRSRAGACPRPSLFVQQIRDLLSRRPSQRGGLYRLGGASLVAWLGLVPTTGVLAQQAPPAPAQGQNQGQVLEEVTVTGSRILRRDFQANAPIQTIDQAAFQSTSTVGVETILNQLPQFVPAITQFTTTDVQQTANNTIGGAFVSLRGLGPNRNLVLIDGKRAQPANPQLFVDTNMIPAAAIQRVEVISGGASAVYGADAVGGVVNFILKDNYEGATVETRIGDTQHGGDQQILISGLIGANVANNRGNVMIGLEHSTRAKELQWQRDWRVSDMANPATTATAFGWGSDTWLSSTAPPPFGGPSTDALGIFNFPSQAYVNGYFSQAQPCTGGVTASPFGYGAGNCPRNAQGINLGVPNNVRFLLNRPSGTVYTGLMQVTGAAGAYKYEGPYYGDNFGNYTDLPYRVVQPDGSIKENNFFQWSSTPLQRDSMFAKGHFDVSDNIRVTGSGMFTRTHTQTSLGLSADNITFWGFPVPFSNNIYHGDPSRGIPNSVNPDGSTNAAYLPGGRFGLTDCPAMGGCTERQTWPLPPDAVALMNSRAFPEANVWLSRPPDYLREADGPRRGENTTTTSQLSLGVEGDLPSGRHHWDVTLTSGYTDNLVEQQGSTRLSTYRAIAASPNFGHGFIGDPNPYVNGFAESIATCASGLPVIQDFPITSDCIQALSPDLKNQEVIKQNVLEANLAGDLANMKAGPLSYALGTDYRYDSYNFKPDNLSLNQNFIDPIAGLFPNEPSGGDYHVTELYGELLIPIVDKGPKGVEHFDFELGGRASDWSMEGVGTVGSYKGLINWEITPKYRIRGGVNRALRAPNLGELYIGRTQIFGGVAAQFQDQCSQNNPSAPYSPYAGHDPAQVAQTLAICRALMGAAGAAQYYDNRPLSQQPTGVGPFGGGNGIQNSFGNPDLHEETADTFTFGIVMNLLEKWQLAVDYYKIDISDMIAVESPDTSYENCLSIAKNPSGSATSPACARIFRNPTDGTPANIDLTYTNQGEAKVEGVDLQLNFTTMIGGGGFNINSVMNYNISSQTQDNPTATTREWSGTQGCGLQIQCQGYDYRVFTNFTYFHGPWSVSLRHQYWPSIKPSACGEPIATTTTGFGNACANALAIGGGVQESYQLVALNGSYRFGTKYTLRVGIENLFDTLPPITGTNPYIANDGTGLSTLAYPNPGSHSGGGLGAGGGATYDPIGRNAFVSFTMDF